MSKISHLTSRDANAVDAFTWRVRDSLRENLVALTLFGSKATGRDVQDSDIDVLVVVNQPNVAMEDLILDIAFEVNLQHGVYLSPKVVTQATLEHPVWRITPFFRNIAKEGIPL